MKEREVAGCQDDVLPHLLNVQGGRGWEDAKVLESEDVLLHILIFPDGRGGRTHRCTNKKGVLPDLLN